MPEYRFRPYMVVLIVVMLLLLVDRVITVTAPSDPETFMLVPEQN